MRGFFSRDLLKKEKKKERKGNSTNLLRRHWGGGSDARKRHSWPTFAANNCPDEPKKISGQINLHPASKIVKRVKKVRVFVFESRVCLNTTALSSSLASGKSPRPVCHDGAPSSACKPKRRRSSLYRPSYPEAVFGQP